MTKQKDKQAKFTIEEYKELYFMVTSHIDWGAGGCYGDGDDITDEKGYAIAKKILYKIRNRNYQTK
jgi:hypothetical protein